MKTLKEQIAIMQAAEDGADIEIQITYISDDSWGPTPYPSWDWTAYDYRVAKPKPREFWRNYYGSAVGRTFDSRSEAMFVAEDGVECVHFREVLEDE